MSKAMRATSLPTPAPHAGGDDQPKRREIIEGARRVFRAEGFDGASMAQIAQSAGVSKGTLYVYFANKEALFEALVVQDRQKAAETMFQVDETESDVRVLLTRLGVSFVTIMVRPDHIALIRMVMGAAEKFPRVGRVFYETGPCSGVARLSAILSHQVGEGRLVIPGDMELAASQFFALCQGKLVKPQLFGIGEAPSTEEIRATVDSAVEVFLKAYGA
ncbi:MAG: TetR/AcrR family transcriptional regulator [Rhodospirillum sp.]|nr:TetR/AcrR family transcriptional regulator [Rhodospirillum sp.]MCF8488813.1 TetR/AcrR family transcriptional regulator [Rhodospirillum sp.]MCF8500849.1 TetR/AcrR family transcriptional regulator [Rhodospirillum sp.]